MEKEREKSICLFNFSWQLWFSVLTEQNGSAFMLLLFFFFIRMCDDKSTYIVLEETKIFFIKVMQSAY